MDKVNQLLPVLTTIAPETTWPITLDDSDVRDVQERTADLLDETRALAVRAEHERAVAGLPVGPQLRTDVRMTQWATRCGPQARDVMVTAAVDPTLRTGADPTDRTGNALLMAVTAGLMLRTAEFDLGYSQHRHDKSVLNRALGAADWVAASLLPDPVTVEQAVKVFSDKLPPGWRWETRPSEQDSGTWRFAVCRTLADRASVELVTVTGADSNPVTVTRERLARAAKQVPMTWFEVCQHIALSQAPLSA